MRKAVANTGMRFMSSINYKKEAPTLMQINSVGINADLLQNAGNRRNIAHVFHDDVLRQPGLHKFNEIVSV